MGKRIRTILIFFVVWLGFPLPALATSIGSMPGGPIASGIGVSEHRREWVRLEPRGGLLVGFPINSPVRMLALYAPSLSKGHVILRWVERENGKTSLLLTAPEEVSAAVRRATMYFEWDVESSTLYEQIGLTWERRQPFLVRAFGLKGGEIDESLTAFVTNGLGRFWMERDVDTADNIAAVVFPPDSPLAGGSWFLAVSSWILPLLVFTAVLSAARRQHRLEILLETAQ